MNQQIQRVDDLRKVSASRSSDISIIVSGLNFRASGNSRSLRRIAALIILMLPTIVAIIYLKVFAVSMYASEVRFFVGGAAEAGGAMGMAKLIPGNLSGGGSTSLIDGFAVRDYLSSYEAFEKLDQETNFLKLMTSSRSDPIYHVPDKSSREERLDFFRSMVLPHFSLTEGIVSVTAYAFKPDDAFKIATAIRKMAEDFSNEMNRRALEGSIQFAQAEVLRAQENLTGARLALDKWRKDNANLNPETNAKMINEIIAQLEGKYIELRSALVEMKLSAENSPQRTALTTKLGVVKEQLEIERRRLTSTDQNESIVNQLLEYQKLVINQEFAAKGYESALQALQGTRVAAGFKQKYVLTVVAPTLPEDSAYPRIWKTLALVGLVSVLSYFMVTLIYSVIRDSHRH